MHELISTGMVFSCPNSLAKIIDEKANGIPPRIINLTVSIASVNLGKTFSIIKGAKMKARTVIVNEMVMLVIFNLVFESPLASNGRRYRKSVLGINPIKTKN